MDVNASLTAIVNALKGVYTCQTNNDRRRLTLELLSLEENLSPASVAAVGVGLLSSASDGPAIRAYGAVVLKNAVRMRKIGTESFPLWDLFTWYCNEPTMDSLLAENLRKLLLESVFCAEQNPVPRMLATLLSVNDLSQFPRRLFLLQDIVCQCMEPDYEHVDGAKIGALKRGIVSQGRPLLVAMTETLFSLFTAAGGAESVSLPAGAELLVDSCFAITSAVAPSVDVTVWAEISFCDTLIALLHWRPGQRLAVTTAAALIRTSSGTNTDRDRQLQQILATVLICLPPSVAARDIGLIDEVLTLLKEVPASMVSQCGGAVCQGLVHVLSVPSVWFAEQVCSLLVGMDERFLRSELDPVGLFTNVHRLAMKHQYDPESGTDPEGKALSQEQLGFVHLYRQTFDSFRSMAGKLVEIVARLHPKEASYCVGQFLSSLPDGRGTRLDQRTRGGFVTQQSQTFLLWEATAFMVEHLAEAFRWSSDHVSECITAIQQHQPADAVLMPLYFNMLSCFWRCRNHEVLNVWSGTLDVLFRYIEESKDPALENDLDQIAARRRAHTLLVTACNEYGALVVNSVGLEVINRVKTALFASRGQERALLYECLAALITGLPQVQAHTEFAALVDPVVGILGDFTSKLSQQEFNTVIIGASMQDRDRRDTLRSTTEILSAVFRRSRQAPYVIERLNSLVPMIQHLANLLHGVRAEDLPPNYRKIFQMHAAERQQFVTGGSRQTDTHRRKSAEDMARDSLMGVRTALYQLIGAVCPLVPVEHLGPLLQGLVSNTDAGMPIHHVRLLVQNCLFPVGEHHPELLSSVISTVAGFFEARLNNSRAPVGDDSVEEKQWFYFSRDALNYVRQRVLDKSLWRQDPGLLGAVACLATAVLRGSWDARTAFHICMAIMDLSESESGHPTTGATSGSRLAQALVDVQKEIFCDLLLHVLREAQKTAPGHAVSREVDSQAYVIAGPYLRVIPNLACCVETLGARPEELDKMHAQVILFNSPKAKQRMIKEFFLSLATKTQVV